MPVNDHPLRAFLPVYRGACVNPACSDSGGQRVLSVRELERVYPATSELSFTPLPDEVSHVCDRCGMLYSDVNIGFNRGRATQVDRGLDIEAMDWEPDRVFETDVRTAAAEFVAECPADADMDAILDGLRRYVTGLDAATAEAVLAESDRDVTMHSADAFM